MYINEAGGNQASPGVNDFKYMGRSSFQNAPALFFPRHQHNPITDGDYCAPFNQLICHNCTVGYDQMFHTGTTSFSLLIRVRQGRSCQINKE